jgi:hypothetical protein
LLSIWRDLSANLLSFQRFPDGEPLASSRVSVVKKKDFDKFINQETIGEPMSQGTNWNLIHRYGESLHSSEVINAREIKFCEGCGVLGVRLLGSKAQFCPDCERPMAIAMRRTQ